MKYIDLFYNDDNIKERILRDIKIFLNFKSEGYKVSDWLVETCLSEQERRKNFEYIDPFENIKNNIIEYSMNSFEDIKLIIEEIDEDKIEEWMGYTQEGSCNIYQGFISAYEESLKNMIEDFKGDIGSIEELFRDVYGNELQSALQYTEEKFDEICDKIENNEEYINEKFLKNIKKIDWSVAPKNLKLVFSNLEDCNGKTIDDTISCLMKYVNSENYEDMISEMQIEEKKDKFNQLYQEHSTTQNKKKGRTR